MDEEIQQLQELKNKLILYFVENGMRLVVAVLILILGFWVAKRIANLILKVCEKKELDPTLARFFAGFSKLVVVGFALIMALSKANIEITPFIALLGASAFGLSPGGAGSYLELWSGYRFDYHPPLRGRRHPDTERPMGSRRQRESRLHPVDQ